MYSPFHYSLPFFTVLLVFTLNNGKELETVCSLKYFLELDICIIRIKYVRIFSCSFLRKKYNDPSIRPLHLLHTASFIKPCRNTVDKCVGSLSVRIDELFLYCHPALSEFSEYRI